MPKSATRTLAAAWCAAFVLAGCGFAESKRDAEAVLNRHFQALAAGDIPAALADYGARFFQETTEDEWANALTKLSEKLGPYQSHSVTSWHVSKKAGTSGSGTTVSLECQVTYARHPAKETFSLFKGPGDSDYAIIAHKIDALALLTE